VPRFLYGSSAIGFEPSRHTQNNFFTASLQQNLRAQNPRSGHTNARPLFFPRTQTQVAMAVKRILYAEDNPDDVMILKLALKRAGVSQPMWVVDDGEMAIEYLGGEGKYGDREQFPPPDLLVLDLKMPKKSGFDVLQWLRDYKRFENLLVVVLSSSDDPRDMTRAAELGVTRYFKKSASCQDVVAFLKSSAAGG
jgi:CheY-like chemotaxis protein